MSQQGTVGKNLDLITSTFTSPDSNYHLATPIIMLTIACNVKCYPHVVDAIQWKMISLWNL